MHTKLRAAILILIGSLLIGMTAISWNNKDFVISPSTIEASAKKSFSLLEKSSYVFTNHSALKCASCHHNTMTSMTAELARNKGISVTDSFADGRVKSMVHTLKLGCNPNYVREFLAANYVAPYILIGLAAEKYPADFYTDISVDYILSQAKPSGGFLTESGRVPLETGTMHLTAMAIRSLQLYASPAKKKQLDDLIASTNIWLGKSTCDQQQEIAFQLLAMQWCGTDITQKKRVAGQLISLQHPDGGWSQLPTLASDAYATGQSLYALLESGMAEPNDPVYQNGLRYLLKTQDAEGAWVVTSRSYPFQPFVSSEFPPYDENQFISASASNWATMALLLALPDKK
jgi:hypothetical protein